METPAEHWNQLSRERLGDAQLLLERGRADSGVLLLLCLVDAGGAFLSGRASTSGSGKDFRAFVARYLSIFANAKLQSEGRSADRITTALDVLYTVVRNGLVHHGQLPATVQLDGSYRTPFSIRTTISGDIAINPFALFGSVTLASQDYAEDLRSDAALASLYGRRLEYLGADPTRARLVFDRTAT